MRNELKNIEEVENYLTGNMTAEENAAFENRVKSDPELEQDVALQRQLMNRIKLQAFKAEMAALHATMAGSGNGPWWKNRLYLNSFFGIVILSVAGAALYLSAFASEKRAQKHGKNQVRTELVLIAKQENSVDLEETKSDTKDKLSAKALTFGKADALLRSFKLKYEVQEIYADQNETFQMKESQSFVHIPANILIDEKGNLVKGKVQIRYREYRNSAQTAFSGIPMTYSEKGKDYNFNSAGMFEIRAFQKGKELKVKDQKSFTVDYNVTEQLDNCSFYVLNEGNGNWQKKTNIAYGTRKPIQAQTKNNQAEVVKKNNQGSPQKKYKWGVIQGTIRDAATNEYLRENVKIELNNISNKTSQLTHYYFDSSYVITAVRVGTYSAKITCKGYASMYVNEIIIADNKISELDMKLKPLTKAKKKGVYQKVVSYFDKNKETDDLMAKVKGSFNLENTVCIIPDDFDENLREKINRGKKAAPVQLNEQGEKFVPIAQEPGGAQNQVPVRAPVPVRAADKNTNQGQSTLLGGGGDIGHTYPNLVRGLNCASFGVYNCDQIYRVSSSLAINANYVDEKGKKIEGAHVLSMVDLSYNGAFSFEPSQFVCNAAGRNVLLLFTKDQQLYALSEAEYKKMNITASGIYTFKMKNIGAKVKDPKDLKVFLGLN